MALVHLILGGARSGKSRLAEKLAYDSELQLVYVATATAGDEEMQARIQRHREDRSEDGWFTVEEQEDLAGVIELYAKQNKCVLIDCLTLWLSNCLHNNSWLANKKRFIEQLEKLQKIETNCQIIMVSNETGLGVVPLGELARTFVDESGFMHQEIASIADTVTLVAAGLPLKLKPKES